MSEIIRDIDELKFADYNPRIMKEFADTHLGNSMDRFGDIRGITFNRQSQTLVTGHQLIRKLKEKYGNRVKVYIDMPPTDPDDYGTVATGFVGVQGMTLRFAYREVSWDRGTEMAANVAANTIDGEDDKEKLAKLDYDLSQMDGGEELLALSGQSPKQVESLLQSIGMGPEPQLPPEEPAAEAEGDKLTFAITSDQKALIERAIQHVSTHRELQADQSASINGAALYVLCKDYLALQPEEPAPQPGELTDIPANV